MDRELLLEIGCEEIPASWLPALTNQVGEVVMTFKVVNIIGKRSPES